MRKNSEPFSGLLCAGVLTDAVRRNHAPGPAHVRRVVFKCRATNQTNLIVLPSNATVRPREAMWAKTANDPLEQR